MGNQSPSLHGVALPNQDTHQDYPRDACVHELFEIQSNRRSGSDAVVFGDIKCTYAELNRRSNQLARYLRKLGVGPEVLVGLCLERSINMVVGLLGILKAGGAYVPLDPAYPKDRIAYIMSDACAPVLLTEQKLLSSLPEQQARVVLLDEHWPLIASEEEGNLSPSASAENLAYVIYTSGSTGKPKGVQLEHRSVVNFLTSMRQTPGLNEDDTLAAVTTICFDIAGLEIYLPLVTGAKVVVVSREEASDGKKLKERMAECGATVMQATPSTWRLLLDAGWSGNPSLKILCGGEAFPRELANRLVSCCGSLWNMYGPTETTIWSAVYRVKSEGSGSVPIGGPIANTQLYILDDEMIPAVLGKEGHLYIGGDGLARGYQNRPDLTAEKFVPDPFRSLPGARLYKTGDLARYFPDGTVEFLGRIDHQVKMHGFRIELGEIECVLAQHPSVRDVVVLAREDSPGDQRLVAYLVANPSEQPATRALRTFLQQKLPDYMVPSVFVVVDALPLTPNGKVDRKALPLPTRKNSAIEWQYVAPRNPLEKQLAGIWEKTLGIRPIGVTDNIFDLGVNSVTAAQLFARIEKTLGRNLPPAPLFQAPTIEELARLLTDRTTSATLTSLVSIQPRGRGTPLFCVHGGAGTILFFHGLARRLAPHRPVYGLQAQGLHGKQLPLATVEEMAAHYIDEILTVQPHGPYLLAGWCFGGIVAFEMAQQLRRAGEEVGMLATFNAPSSRNHRAIETDGEDTPIWNTAEKHWQAVKNQAPSEKIAYFYDRVRTRLVVGKVRVRRKALLSFYRLTFAPRKKLFRYYIERRKPLPDFLRNSYFRFSSVRAELQYRLRAYDGTMVVFRDQGPYADPQLGWSDWVQGGIETYEIAVSGSDHRSLMAEPAVEILAKNVEEYIVRHLLPREPASDSERPSQSLVSSGLST